MDTEGEGKLNGLDLFSGIGGISQALAPWVRTIAYCERERYPQAVLLSRMERGEIDVAPIWDDVCTLNAGMLPRIDIISGGFPCQDLSTAGLRKGLAGERSGLFYEIVRLTRKLQPRFVFMENVAGIFAGDTLGAVGGALAAIGYDCRWGVLSAYDVEAPHLRERWFALAHHSKIRFSMPQTLKGMGWNGLTKRSMEKNWWKFKSNETPDMDKSSLGRMVNGIRERDEQIKCLGNGVVPQQVQEAFQRLAGLKNPWEVK